MPVPTIQPNPIVASVEPAVVGYSYSISIPAGVEVMLKGVINGRRRKQVIFSEHSNANEVVVRTPNDYPGTLPGVTLTARDGPRIQALSTFTVLMDVDITLKNIGAGAREIGVLEIFYL